LAAAPRLPGPAACGAALGEPKEGALSGSSGRACSDFRARANLGDLEFGTRCEPPGRADAGAKRIARSSLARFTMRMAGRRTMRPSQPSSAAVGFVMARLPGPNGAGQRCRAIRPSSYANACFACVRGGCGGEHPRAGSSAPVDVHLAATLPFPRLQARGRWTLGADVRGPALHKPRTCALPWLSRLGGASERRAHTLRRSTSQPGRA